MPKDRTLISLADLVGRASSMVDPETLLVLAARDEFDGQPPDDVAAWLPERGVSVA